MLQECLRSDYQRKFSMENFSRESALNVAKDTLNKCRAEVFQHSNLAIGKHGCTQHIDTRYEDIVKNINIDNHWPSRSKHESI